MSDTEHKNVSRAKEELAAAQQYRLALVQQGAAMRQAEKASQKSSVRAKPDEEDDAKVRRATRLRP